MKADPFVQARLLELQALDTRLQQIDHARGRVPQIAALAEAGRRLQQVSDDVVRVETGLSDIRREVDRAEADVQQVRDRAARDQARLDAGTGMTSRDLTSLQHELETLARRQSALEEVEIEVMERQESAEARLAETAGLHDLLDQHLSVDSPAATVKTACVVAGMLAGADSIDDLDLLRHAGWASCFAGSGRPRRWVRSCVRSPTANHVNFNIKFVLES